MSTMQIVLFVAELLVVIGSIVMGVRLGGMGLGIWGAVGVAILVFIFRLKPGEIPISAILIILAVITAASTMQAAGGIDFLVGVAAKIIRKQPKYITFVAPLVSYLFVVGAGTSNIFFPLIPVIYETSYNSGIRPERPLSLSVIATGFGITSSPVSAAMAAMIGLVAAKGVGVGQIVLLTIPCSIIAICVGALVMMRYGKDLKDDPIYQQRLKDGLVPPQNSALMEKGATPDLPKGAARSAYIFLAGVVAIVVIGLLNGKELFGKPIYILVEGADITTAIQLIMFVVALLIIVSCKVDVANIIKQATFSSGIIAIVALFGIAWLANTFIAAYQPQIVALLNNWVTAVPVVFAFAVFIFAALTTSQSATTLTIVPIGLALPALGVGQIVAMWQALCGVYFLPANGNQLAVVNTDLTGSTRIGKYVLNHSFMVPLLVCTTVAVGVGMVLQNFIPW